MSSSFDFLFVYNIKLKMAMVLQDMDNDSRSQSVASDVNESDHNEVHNTYKHRGKVLIRWKRLVKVNSLIYLLFG